MLLDHCYTFGLLLSPSNSKERSPLEKGLSLTYYGPALDRPLADLAQKSIQMFGVMSTLSLPSLVNIHQAIR